MYEPLQKQNDPEIQGPDVPSLNTIFFAKRDQNWELSGVDGVACFENSRKLSVSTKFRKTIHVKTIFVRYFICFT